ncbi:MAG: carboxypeptidase regulatory-like domain-containing protein [Acidobacteriota bacterium]|nr:carboxypeptidase regulatory-like domain-containing protein [Acidobacteriota bacterium]
MYRSSMSSRSSLRIRLFGKRALVTLIASILAATFALSIPAPLSAQTATGTVRGLVTDPDAAIIPGAAITLTPASGAAIASKSGSDGTYRIAAPAGVYTLTVSMPNFATMSKTGLKIVAGQAIALDAKLIVGEQTQVIDVTSDAIAVSVDQDSNASSTVIKGKDLEALSDDPDELSSELSALAGPSAGPNGGQIYVDGFTGGQLPPKSSIREIRVNQNPFSAQFDRLGYGRVEVFTKPGTDKFHGNFNINGDPSQFNSGNPLTPTITQPPYHTIFLQGNITGPVTRASSFSIGGSHRDIQDDTITNAKIPVDSTGAFCPPGNLSCTQVPFQFANYFPQIRTEVSPRFDLALGEKNTLTTRFQYVRSDTTNNGTGGPDLPETAFNTTSQESEIQVSDTQTFSPRLINEMRFEFERGRDSQTALNHTPSVAVSGLFNSGGSSLQNSSVHNDHVEVQNYTSLALARNFIRMGARLRINREAENSQAGTNGFFVYNTFTDYLSNTIGQFSLTRVNVPAMRATVADLGLYLEDDWKARPNLTVTYGFRYEAQNNISDHHDIAPRVSFAYGLGSSKTAPKTVIRGGFGMFYTRFDLGNVITLARENGTVTTLFTLNGSSPGCSPSNVGACTTGVAAGGNTTYTRTAGLRTPYILQFALGADQQVSRFGTVSVNYLHARGVHQFASQNAAYPLTGIPAPGAPVVYQYFSEGVFNQNQLIVNANFRAGRWLSLFGYYATNYANGDTSGIDSFITVPHNIAADYGRTTFAVRNRLFMAGSISLPHSIQISPFMVAQSGNPYNVVIGSDLNGDSIRNERPVFGPANGIAAGTAGTNTIAGCGSFVAPPLGVAYTPVPINLCTGPSLFTLNFRMTKSIGLGPRTDAAIAAAANAASHDHGGVGGPRGGRGGGAGIFGAGGGGSGRRYNVGFGVIVQNIFANHDFANPNGTLNSQLFGQSTQLVGRAYSTNAALRRISLSTSFNF